MIEPAAFAEPWEARIFAMVRSLRDRGVVSPAEWTAALTTQVGDRATGEVEYQHWLAALEDVLVARGVVSNDALHRYHAAWEHAAHRTPHGDPITLTINDFAG
jgi:nitrile hydratase accessory protein